MGFLKRLVDGLNHAEFELPSYKASYFDKHIVAVHFYHNLAFIQKGRNDHLGGDASFGRTVDFN
jgi:demethylmacrocin O-methyltransferase